MPVNTPVITEDIIRIKKIKEIYEFIRRYGMCDGFSTDARNRGGVYD